MAGKKALVTFRMFVTPFSKVIGKIGNSERLTKDVCLSVLSLITTDHNRRKFNYTVHGHLTLLQSLWNEMRELVMESGKVVARKVD